MKLDDWQKEILDYDGNIILCTGRQVGKTTTFATKAAEYMIENPGSKIIAVSLTEDQAFIMRAMVEDYIRKNHKAYLRVPKKKKPTKSQINLNNKSSYTVRPVGQTGNALRGFTGDILIVDEASFMPELLWAAAKPTLLTTAGKIWMCSTPNTKEGWFYEQFEAARKGTSDRFKVWHISSEKVMHERPISEGWDKSKRKKAIEFLEAEKETMSRARYGQEYLGLFMEDLMRQFSDEWINNVCTASPETVMTGREYFLGVDIARLGGDETAFEIVRKEGDECIHVYDEHRKDTLTTWTEERILQLDKVYNFQKIYIDAGSGSLGVGVFDHLFRNEDTKRKVEAINNRQMVMDKDGKRKQRLLKEDLYDNLLRLGEQGKLRLIDSDSVRASLRSITKEVTTSKMGRSRLVISGTYSHIAEGLIRAAVCVKEKQLNIFVSSFKI